MYGENVFKMQIFTILHKILPPQERHHDRVQGDAVLQVPAGPPQMSLQTQQL